MKKRILLMCALLISVITLSGAANRSFHTTLEQWNPIGFTQSQAGAQTTNLTAGSAILPTVATAAPSGVLRGGSKNEINFGTARTRGTIELYMEYTGAAPILSGATGTPESGKKITYTLTKQTLTITGDVTVLDCSNNDLTCLYVTQKNTALEKLVCRDNQLFTLSVSQCTELKELDCAYNQMTALDVSQNTKLTDLNCLSNKLTAMDVSRNTALEKLTLRSNKLTTLNVSQNTALTKLDCAQNQLTTLDVSRNTALKRLICFNTQLTTLDLSHNTELTELSCWRNQLTNLDVSKNTALADLNCSENPLTALDVSKNTKLTDLACWKNQLTALDVSKNTALTSLVCLENQLTALDVSRNTALKWLRCGDNQLTALDVSQNTALTSLQCDNNQLTALDVSKNTELESLYCHGNQIKGDEMIRLVNGLPDRTGKEAGTIYVVQSDAEGNRCFKSDVAIAKGKNWNTKKYNSDTKEYVAYEGEEPSPYIISFTTAKLVGEEISLSMKYSGATPVLFGATGTPVSGTKVTYTLTSQTVTIRGDVTELFCNENKLTTLDVSQNTALTKLVCYKNQLTALDVSKNTALTRLSCEINQLTALDLSKNTALTVLYCYDNQLTALDVSQNTALTMLSCLNNELTALDVSKNTALTELYCYDNQLTALDVSQNTALTNLDCQRNQLTTLDVSKNTALNTALTSLNCSQNQLTALDVSRNTALTALWCSSNPLTALDVSQNTALTTLDCSQNQLTALDVSRNTALTQLSCSENQLTALDVSKNTALTTLACSKNQLKALDVSQNTSLIWVSCLGNQIKGAEMTLLVNSLPDRTGKEAGKFTVVQEPDLEGNICHKSDVAIAKGKNWQTYKYNYDTKEYVAYEGAEKGQPLKVTLTKEGEGTITATGATDLNAVPLGTELTIEATPAAGYELKALTANGTDILATKKFVVTAATEVKAIFTKKTYAVTLTKEGEGTITATGATDLNTVPFGTELTIVATPAEGYELTALTANGTDILATKKFVVTGATEVKATFTKKTYAVTLTKVGEGMLDVTGADDLTAVLEGTELMVVATPAAGYELKALTANGADILATKKFTVTAATEVKATFTKKTAADRVEAGTLCLYPNPADTYVNVKAAKADALVRLYDANGTLRYEARTDADGTLQIDLSAYAEGVYLLRVGDDAQRLLIQR